MNRRTFLLKGMLATAGLTALPAASVFGKYSHQILSQEDNIPASLATEDEAVQDIVEYVHSWEKDLPGRKIRELVVKRLLSEDDNQTNV